MRGGWMLGGVVAALLLTACGGDDGTADTEPDRATTEPDRVENVAELTTVSTVQVAPTTVSTVEVAPTTVATTTPVDAVLPEGFESVQASVTLDDGTVCELCVWLADDADRRSRGLMYVTDLGGADAMAFTFDEPTTAQFWMGNTPMSLSIAYFATDGSFVSTADMAPCLEADDACPRYAAAGEYATAIEFPLGDVAELGIGAGSVLALTDLPCA